MQGQGQAGQESAPSLYGIFTHRMESALMLEHDLRFKHRDLSWECICRGTRDCMEGPVCHHHCHHRLHAPVAYFWPQRERALPEALTR